MKNDIHYTFRGRVLVHTCISGMISGMFMLFFMSQFQTIGALFERWGWEHNFFLAIEPGTYAEIVFIFLLTLGLFTVIFLILQLRQIQYMEEILYAMEDISAGNLQRTVEVKGDDELTDIAMQLNHMSEQICLLMEREHKAEQTKNDLITSLAHDLRTPLTSILGYVDLLVNTPSMDPAMKQKYLEVVQKKSRHLQMLIENLFSFTKLSNGNLQLNIGQIDIVKLLEQLLDEFYPQFTQNHLEYKYTPSVNSLIITADGTLLARLFDNLLSNAVKYGKDGKLIRVKLHTAGSHVTVQVLNYGTPIPEKELPLIFDQFYRMEQSRSTSTGGSGLGLAIAKQIAVLHGGSIEAKSSRKETAFIVRLPLKHPFDPKTTET